MNNAPAATHDRAVYLYCLSRPECLPAIQGQNLPGVDERHPVTALEVGGSDVAAVIGEVDPAEFSEHNLQTLSWLGVRAQRHEAVVERVMGASTVLPVKFGTLFSSRASLRKFIERHRVDIALALDDLQDKVEWSVKGYLTDAVALPIVVAADDEIQSRLAALSPSPGARYIQQRQLDAKIEAALHSWLTRTTDAIQSALISHAVASTPLRCHSNAVTGRPARMVFNTSFLLADKTGFCTALSEQQTVYQGSGLTLELQGPWPPYNFCPALAGVAS
ncbi:MAG: GvpL/GvpF family gas vesicle protein [Gallionella sp.]|jgi:hypothetical protein